MRIATFNVQNLRLRSRGAVLHLDGARDDDAPGESGPAAEALDGVDRDLTARLLAEANADLAALQEVFDQASLDHFHDALLAPRGLRYPHRVCIEGNDGRSEDIALMSRHALLEVRSHAHLTFADVGALPPRGHAETERVFRRDCLAAQCGPLWVFVCHFKASAPDDELGRAIRRAEAHAVRRVIERCIADPADALWLALGDFNAHDAAGEEDLRPLTHNFAVDLCARMPADERWTYFQPWTGGYSCPDRLFASPALAERCEGAPTILKSGLGRAARAHAGPRLDGVGETRPHASDHALLMIDLDI